jgi:hypothetical protein
MRMSTIQLPIRSMATLMGLLALLLLSLLASPARGETAAAPVEPVKAAAASVAETAAATVPESVPAPSPDPAVPSESEEEVPASSSDSGPSASVVTAVEKVVPAVEKQVADVAAKVTGGEAAEQVKAATEEATAPLKSVADAAGVQPAIDKVVEEVGGVERLPEATTPHDPTAAGPLRHAPSEAHADAPEAPGPMPWIGGEGPDRTFEDAVALEAQPVAGWIAGLDLSGFMADAAPMPLQGPNGFLSLPNDAIVTTAGSHTSPGGSPAHSPLPGSAGLTSGPSSTAAPGLGGGSFFVPIAALLALLALAAPAISRRAKEALAAPVPSQFVCALERPG